MRTTAARRLFPLLLLLLSLACPALAQTIPCRVVGVHDGDTITVLTPTKRQAKVRLHGIDAPELAQPFGSRARQFTAALVFGKSVSVIISTTDRYGRAVGDVTVGGRSVNQEIVGAGLAWWYREYAPHDATLAARERQARAARRGLWADARPVPPWEWRHGHGAAPRLPSATARAPRQSSASAAPLSVASTVYVTRTGRKYHRAGCTGLSRSRIAASRASAQARGHTPCGLCRP